MTAVAAWAKQTSVPKMSLLQVGDGFAVFLEAADPLKPDERCFVPIGAGLTRDEAKSRAGLFLHVASGVVNKL